MEGPDDIEKPDMKRFSFWYIGWSSLDRRTTLPMLPWLVAEIRRKSEKNESGCETGPVQAREVQLVLTPLFIRCIPANNATNLSVFIFEHNAQCFSRFIHNSNDLTYFADLIGSQPDNPELEMACHVFRANDPNQMPNREHPVGQYHRLVRQLHRPQPQGSPEGGTVWTMHHRGQTTCPPGHLQHPMSQEGQKDHQGQRPP